ncbi:hypothetical protein [Brevibacillus sp. VP]|uniref:hypothetical protein n=1 Tax=unclassified Brevibacillus TaxID=2684853 RepID=UPI000E2FE9FB|nr:hypothetical protein [Brevibacillus sp. VP]RFB35730.1 hypothetical protein DZB91_09565 [Brevibacillus sp. VP]
MRVNGTRFLQRIKQLQSVMSNGVDEVAEHAAREIHEKAVEYASGPMNPEWKQQQARTSQRTAVRNTGKKKIKHTFTNDSEYKWYKEVMTEGKNAPWPVSVNTGSFRRAHKVTRVRRGVWKVWGDSQVANYFAHVHNGTIRMRGRPTIGKAFQEFRESNRIIHVGKQVFQKKLRGMGW